MQCSPFTLTVMLAILSKGATEQMTARKKKFENTMRFKNVCLILNHIYTIRTFCLSTKNIILTYQGQKCELSSYKERLQIDWPLSGLSDGTVTCRMCLVTPSYAHISQRGPIFVLQKAPPLM